VDWEVKFGVAKTMVLAGLQVAEVRNLVIPTKNGGLSGKGSICGHRPT
jgi:hypothetical protein